jgi:hypothetical protein
MADSRLGHLNVCRMNERCQQVTGGLAQLGGKVFARTVVCPLTVGGCPKCVQLNPQLRQAARALCVSAENAVYM